MRQEQTRLLVIEDNPGDVRLIEEMLSDSSPGEFTLEHAGLLSLGIERLEAGDIDAVLVDLGLPDSQGLGTFEAIRANAPDIPVLVLTGFDDAAKALEAVQKGAQDYLVKGESDGRAIARSIRYSRRRVRSISEEQERQKAELRVRDDFLSHVSHELRTPLTAIHDFVSILVDGLAGPLTKEQEEYLQITLRNTKQLRAMIDDLLEVTRSEANKVVVEPRPIRLAGLVRQAAESQKFQARAKSVVLDVDVPADLPLVEADAKRTLQILTNLIENAIKFSELSGEVRVDAARWPHDERFLRVRVADTGPGIPPDMASQIFDYLYQGHDPAGAPRRGLGIGLYLCKDLVVRQGGRIWVEDRLGGGSIFAFTLPVYSVQEALAPILEEDSRLESFALVSFRIASREASRDLDPEEIESIRGVLERCSYAYRDVVLPTLDQRESVVFPVLLSGDERSAGVFAERARSMMTRLGVLEESAHSCSVRVQPLTRGLSATDAADGPVAVVAAVRRLLVGAGVPVGEPS